MPDNSDLQLINKINSALVGTLDFRELARQAAQIVLRELDLAAVAIFRVDHQTGEMHPYAYATKIRQAQITKIARQAVSGPAAPPDALAIGAVRFGKASSAAASPESVKDTAGERMLATRFHTSLPLKTKGKTEGVLFCATQQGRLTPEQLSLLKTAADQLGLAISNVIAHEKIIAQFKNSLKSSGEKEGKIPKIKFTLRITKEIEQFLNYKVANTKHSKANYVRAYLEETMGDDPAYNKFLGSPESSPSSNNAHVN